MPSCNFADLKQDKFGRTFYNQSVIDVVWGPPSIGSGTRKAHGQAKLEVLQIFVVRGLQRLIASTANLLEILVILLLYLVHQLSFSLSSFESHLAQ